MPASVSLTSGNVCEIGMPITSWPVCRAALSLYSGFRIDGDDYLGIENDADWPKGCYYCDSVPGCTDGVWFNKHPSGAANGAASIICSQNLEPVKSGGTLFVGDSDIDYWRGMESVLSAEKFQPVLNVGYGGYTCEKVLNEADQMIATLQPSRVVLVCGENDLANGSTVGATFTRYSEVVKKYVAAGAKVFSFSTKPEPNTAELHKNYEALDALIKPFTVDGSLTFIDSYAGFNAIGNPSSGSENLYDSDGLHLNAKGYALWKTWLEIALENEESGCQVYTSGVCVQGAKDIPTNLPTTNSPTNLPTNNDDDSQTNSLLNFPINSLMTVPETIAPTNSPTKSPPISPTNPLTEAPTDIRKEVEPTVGDDSSASTRAAAALLSTAAATVLLAF